MGVYDNYSCDGQLSLFDIGKSPYRITKPIRLISLFAGYDSQSLALQRLGCDFESWKISEWDVYANSLCKAAHYNDDNTDYSVNMSTEDVIQALIKFGISNNGKTSMTEKQIRGKGESWQRKIYNEFRSTKNLGSITNIKGGDLEITNTIDRCYIMTYSFP